MRAACEDQFTAQDGTVKPPDVITGREFDVQRLINGLSQHIARVERSWHKALDTPAKAPKPSPPGTGSARYTRLPCACRGKRRIRGTPGEKCRAKPPLRRPDTRKWGYRSSALVRKSGSGPVPRALNGSKFVTRPATYG
jgi:hypothetical protein